MIQHSREHYGEFYDTRGHGAAQDFLSLSITLLRQLADNDRGLTRALSIDKIDVMGGFLGGGVGLVILPHG